MSIYWLRQILVNLSPPVPKLKRMQHVQELDMGYFLRVRLPKEPH